MVVVLTDPFSIHDARDNDGQRRMAKHEDSYSPPVAPAGLVGFELDDW